MEQQRRQSMGAIEREGTKCENPFPRRNSVIVTSSTKPKCPLLSRRHSEQSFSQIQPVCPPIRETHRVRTEYTVISSSKEIKHRETVSKPNDLKGYKVGRQMTCADVVLPRIPSATPEPDIVKHASEHDVHYDVDGNLYQPKNCWCFRCQMMYSMYQNGDERLAMWECQRLMSCGPCFMVLRKFRGEKKNTDHWTFEDKAGHLVVLYYSVFVSTCN